MAKYINELNISDMRKILSFLLLLSVLFTVNAQRTVQGIAYDNPKKVLKTNPVAMASEGTFTFDDIKNWTGEGEKQAAVVIQWNTGKDSEVNSLAFGYRWNGEATGADMLVAIAKNNPRLYVLVQGTSLGYTVNGVGWDADNDGEIGLIYTTTNKTYEIQNGVLENPESGYNYDYWTAKDADDYWQSGWYQGYWSYWLKSDASDSWGYASTGASGRVLTDGSWDGWSFCANMGRYSWLPTVSAPATIPEGAITEFKVNGIYYTLKDFEKKTVSVSAPFEMEKEVLTSYNGIISIPATFVYDEVTYNVTEIGDAAFAKSAVTKVTLPESVTKIGKYAFQDSKLAEINITDNVTKLDVGAFSGCTDIKSFKLPSSVNAIPNELYKGTGITSVELSNLITSVGDNAFSGCTSLSIVSLGTSIETIGASAFEGCNKLSQLVLPASVKTIGESAFADCSGLKSVKTSHIVPVAITDNVFSSTVCENATLIVPFDYKSVYQSATGWKNFKNISEELITIKEGDYFYKNNVAYIITALTDAEKTVKVTYFATEDGSVNDYKIANSNKLGYVGDIVIPETISYQKVEFKVTAMDKNVFRGATDMTSMVIKCKVDTLPENSFYNCSNLTSVLLPESLKAVKGSTFYLCKKLKSVILPESVKDIPDRMLYGCSDLSEFKCSNDVSSIGKDAFYSCGLTSLTLPTSLTKIGYEAFSYSKIKSIVIPSGVKELPERIFQSCSNLEKVTLHSNIKSIGSYAFYKTAVTKLELPQQLTTLGESALGSTKLIEVTIPDGVVVLERNLFAGSEDLKNVALKGSVTTLNEGVFKSCPSLQTIQFGENKDAKEGEIVIPETVTVIGRYLFSGCATLKSVTFPDSITELPMYVLEKCTSLTDVIMNNNVKTIGNYAFDGCSSLDSISLPSSLTSLGTYAFRNCKALKSLSIPEGVKTIPYYMANGCTSLTSVTYGDITKIDSYAFANTALEELIIPASVTSLSSNIVNGCKDVKVYACASTPMSWSYGDFKTANNVYAPVYVVCGAKTAYEAANGWKKSTINEVLPTVAIDTKQQQMKIDYYNVVLSVPVLMSLSENLPKQFKLANYEVAKDAAVVTIEYRKISTSGEPSQSAEAVYESKQADLQEDGTYKVDLFSNVESNSRYEYRWVVTFGENEPTLSAVDFFNTGYLVTGVAEIGSDSELDVEYYNLQGLKVDVNTMEPGVYIKKQGNKTTKVLIK